jgi:hypothetical protein
MDIVDKIRTDLNNASVSLAGISAFSTKDKMIVALMVIFPVALNNLLYWFLQDILLTQVIVVVVGYFLAPFLLRQIIHKDIYVLLDGRDSFSGVRPAVSWIWVLLAVGIPALFLLLGLWLGLFGIHSILLLAPIFARSWENYLYVVLASVVFCFIHSYFEARFYYGVIDAIIPPNIVGRLILALILTLNYLAFSFALLGKNYGVAIAIAVIFGTYFVISYVSLHKGVNVAIFMAVAVATLSWVLFLLFVLAKKNGSYTSGVPLILFNPRNVFN